MTTLSDENNKQTKRQTDKQTDWQTNLLLQHINQSSSLY